MPFSDAAQMSVSQLKEAVRDLIGGDAMATLLERCELERAYVDATLAADAQEEEEIRDTFEWAAGRSMNDLVASLRAMGVDRNEVTSLRSKRDMVKKYVWLLVEEKRTDPTLQHQGEDCSNCPECRARRKALKREAREERTCEACGKPSKQLCSHCKLSSFCSRECQVQAWPAHRVICKHRCARDVAISQMLGSSNANEYCVHYVYWKGEERSGNGSFDLHKGKCLTMDAVDYDDITSSVSVQLHFMNKAPKRALDDQYCLIYHRGEWNIVALANCVPDNPDWPQYVMTEIGAYGHLGVHVDADADAAYSALPPDATFALETLYSGLEYVYKLAALRSCGNPHCQCIFSQRKAPGDGRHPRRDAAKEASSTAAASSEPDGKPRAAGKKKNKKKKKK